MSRKELGFELQRPPDMVLAALLSTYMSLLFHKNSWSKKSTRSSPALSAVLARCVLCHACPQRKGHNVCCLPLRCDSSLKVHESSCYSVCVFFSFVTKVSCTFQSIPCNISPVPTRILGSREMWKDFSQFNEQQQALKVGGQNSLQSWLLALAVPVNSLCMSTVVQDSCLWIVPCDQFGYSQYDYVCRRVSLNMATSSAHRKLLNVMMSDTFFFNIYIYDCMLLVHNKPLGLLKQELSCHFLCMILRFQFGRS